MFLDMKIGQKKEISTKSGKNTSINGLMKCAILDVNTRRRALNLNSKYFFYRKNSSVVNEDSD